MAKLKDNTAQLAALWLKGQTIYKQSAKAVGLTDNFITVLHAIYQSPDDCSQKYLVDQTYLPKQTIHFVVERLQGQGLVTTGQSTNDGRVKVVRLTSKGQTYVQQVIVPFEKDAQKALDSLTGKEQEQLLQLLGKYLGKLNQQVNQNLLKDHPFKPY